jgi:hypothetical protein
MLDPDRSMTDRLSHLNTAAALNTQNHLRVAGGSLRDEDDCLQQTLPLPRPRENSTSHSPQHLCWGSAAPRMKSQPFQGFPSSRHSKPFRLLFIKPNRLPQVC